MRFLTKKNQIILALILVTALLSFYMVKELGSQDPQIPTSSGKQAKPVMYEQNAQMKTSTETPIENVDVVVIGSELEGLYLARAAADEGLYVKILDPKEAFGGQALQGQMLFLDEARDGQNKSLLQGRVKELFEGFKSGKIRKLPEFQQAMSKLVSNIPIESGVHIDHIDATKTEKDSQIVNTLTYTTKEGEHKKISSSYWVENTDNAALLSHLQTTRLPGLEKLYKEPNIDYMSAGMMMKFKHVDWQAFNSKFNSLKQEDKNKKFGGGYVNDSYAIGLSGVTNAYKPTNERIFLRGLNAVNQRDGEVLINALLVFSVDPANDKSIQEAVELGQKEMPLILDHFRKTLPGWEQAELNGLPSYPYIREYNHYETDYVLKPSDLLSAKMFWDNVSIGGYPIDLQGTIANKWGIEIGRPDKYGMPLRSFLLKNYDNIILAGKNVGSTALAYGSTRIQPNTSLAAESIGVILGQIHGKQKLKELKEADMNILHHYLENRYHIKLSGITGTNKLIDWTSDEIQKLDNGEMVYTSRVKPLKTAKPLKPAASAAPSSIPSPTKKQSVK